jgi:hypothetical protein
VSYIAAIPQDGCPFCCAFACQGSPTPTPAFDSEGRRIFFPPSGDLLLVIEGARGTSNRDPGEKLIVEGDERPDLQVLFANDLGNGSSLTCDIGPAPNPSGGVPGIDPPVFGPGPDVTAALQDIACRFSLHTTSAEACTKDDFGHFSYRGSGTRLQYCLAVSHNIAFAPGPTVVAVQLADNLGNIGPIHEIVVDVPP